MITHERGDILRPPTEPSGSNQSHQVLPEERETREGQYGRVRTYLLGYASTTRLRPRASIMCDWNRTDSCALAPHGAACGDHVRRELMIQGFSATQFACAAVPGRGSVAVAPGAEATGAKRAGPFACPIISHPFGP